LLLSLPRQSVRKELEELKKIVDNAIQKEKNDRLFNQINHFIVRTFSHISFLLEKENTSVQ
jgi:hypothetical protein